MTLKPDSKQDWGTQYRLIASEKWKAKSAAMGQPVTDALVEYAQRAQARGLENFTTQQGDAHSLPFPDNSFDLATSRFGVMFFHDPNLAMSELRRVLRPGARACFLAWGPFDQPFWQSMMGVVQRHVGGPLLQPDAPNPFRFSEPGSLS